MNQPNSEENTMPERVKVFEENASKREGIPVWVWILAAIVLLGLVTIFATRRNQ